MTKQIAIILLSFLFVAWALWTKNNHTIKVYYGIISFFGFGGIFMLARLLNSKIDLLSNESKFTNEPKAERFKIIQEDNGLFKYNEIGFSLTDNKSDTHYNWTDIENIFAYKEDRFTTDEICLDIFTVNKCCITLTESTVGWYQFNYRQLQHFPTISQWWESNIVVPAFETKLTLLYDKEKRSQESAIERYYK